MINSGAAGCTVRRLLGCSEWLTAVDQGVELHRHVTFVSENEANLSGI
jgi:hypothetical protein